MYQHKEPNIKIIYGGGGCVWISGFGCSVFITFFFSYNDLCNMRYGIIKPLWTFKVDMEDSIIWQMEWNEIGLTFTLTLYVYIKAITRFFSHWIYSPHWKQMIKTQIIIIPNKTKPDDLIFVTVCFPFLCWGFFAPWLYSSDVPTAKFNHSNSSNESSRTKEYVLQEFLFLSLSCVYACSVYLGTHITILLGRGWSVSRKIIPRLPIDIPYWC